MKKAIELPNKFVHCPNCDEKLDSATGLGERDIPKEGDVSVCTYCGTILMYEEGLFLHKADKEELNRLFETSPTAYHQVIIASSLIKK